MQKYEKVWFWENNNMKGCDNNDMASVSIRFPDGNMIMIVCGQDSPCSNYGDCRECPKCKKYWSVTK